MRAELRPRPLRYVLDVPCHTRVREPTQRRPPRQPGGKPRRPVFERVAQWVARQPAGRWRTVRRRDGEHGPLRGRVLWATVQTKDAAGRVGPQERLVVLRSVEAQPRTTYAVSNARHEGRAVYARVQGQRHGIEELLEEGKEEVGLDEYEVRSWVGWQHHLTLTLLALWFVQVEKRRWGGKTPAVTAAQVRALFTELLRVPAATAAEIVAVLNRTRRRQDEARIYPWQQTTGAFPPRRPRLSPLPRGRPTKKKLAQ